MDATETVLGSLPKGEISAGVCLIQWVFVTLFCIILHYHCIYLKVMLEWICVDGVNVLLEMFLSVDKKEGKAPLRIF